MSEEPGAEAISVGPALVTSVERALNRWEAYFVVSDSAIMTAAKTAITAIT